MQSKERDVAAFDACEIGHRALKEKIAVDPERIQTVVREYAAAEGKELFVSLEEPEVDALIGYLRLRLPSRYAHRPEVDASTAIVRELHVYGPEVPVGRRYADAWQHTGFGGKLLLEGELMAKDRGATKVLILSALGTKRYYKRAGYDYIGSYMGKRLN